MTTITVPDEVAKELYEWALAKINVLHFAAEANIASTSDKTEAIMLGKLCDMLENGDDDA